MAPSGLTDEFAAAAPGLRPHLIVITGRPGAGKTTLAHLLAARLTVPLIARDAIKAGYVFSGADRGAPGDVTTMQVYATFFETIESLLDRNISLLAEAAFQHHVWAPKLRHLAKRAEVRIVICDVPASIARSRMATRLATEPDRRLYHHDEETLRQEDQHYAPPQLDLPTLTVRTAEGYEPGIEAIAAFVRNPR